MKQLSLVTGANGLLGNTLVRELISQGKPVRASIRNVEKTEPFEDLDCEIVYADIFNKQSLINAMDGVDILYHVAAVFKHWSKDPQKEIIDANLIGTRNVLEAAAESSVKKIIYVSSIAALDRSNMPMDESSWGTVFPNHYYKAKNDSEKLAWEIADKLNLWMVTILPSGIIGTQTYEKLSATNTLLNMIVKNKLPVDPNFMFNFVHASDVAKGMILAAGKGVQGERYVLATESPISTTRIIDIARELLSDMNIKKPDIASKDTLMNLALNMEEESEITHKPPLLLVDNVKYFYGVEEKINISKASNLL